MKWLEMTSGELADSVKECQGVCIIPLGSIEAHGNHLPLGTDTIAVEGLVAQAAAIEPVVEFPSQYFGMVPEVRHQPGSIVTPVSMLLAILDNICEEVSRNGFKKIMLVNGHGGNVHLTTFAVSRLEKRHDYTVYMHQWPADTSDPEWQAMAEGSDGHAGEGETSIIMHMRPELVKMGKILKGAKQGLPRLSHLHKHNVRTGFDWYGANPDHYVGDAVPSTTAKGAFLVKRAAESLATAFRAVKDDSTGPDVLKEFYDKAGLK